MRLLLCAAVLLLSALLAAAQTPPSQITTDINTTLASGQNPPISAAQLRSILNEMNISYANLVASSNAFASGLVSITPPPNALSGPGLLITSNNIFGTPGAPTGFLDVGWPFNSVICNDSGVNVSAFPAGSQTVPCLSVSYVGRGTNGQGGAIQGTTYIATSPAQASNQLNQFAAGQFITQNTVNLGGTNLTTGAVGAIFGLGASAYATNTATDLLNVTGAELDAGIYTGASSNSFSVLSLATLGSHAVAGGTYDTSLSISAASGALGVTNGILFSNYNGQQPLSTSGCVICTQGSSTVTTGIDFSSYTFTGNFLNFGSNFSVTHSGTATFGNTVAVGTVSGTQTVLGGTQPMISRNGSNGAVTICGQSGAPCVLGTATGTVSYPGAATGTPAASLCLDASNNIIKKTTSGSCI